MKSILIVGHGLAGAILAHTLINRGIKVTCTEGQIKHSASRIAAGLINPFIGPKLNPPPAFGKCMESNFQFFRKWEEEFGEKLYKSESLIRIFTSQKQANKWIDLTKNETTSKYTLSLIPGKKLEKLGIKAKYGAGETKVFRLNIENFLRLSRLKLKSINSWNEEIFKPTDGSEADAIIFAEGYNVCDNPYFNWLPFAPAQGEILELSGPDLPAMSNGTWFLPSSTKRFLAGSTWKHTNLKSGPTKLGYDTIYENLKFMPISQYKKTNHLSGIRSGTKDRNPIIGRHPKFRNLYVFNGFGSRGSTIIVKYADHMANLIINSSRLPVEIDLHRYINLYPR